MEYITAAKEKILLKITNIKFVLTFIRNGGMVSGILSCVLCLSYL